MGAQGWKERFSAGLSGVTSLLTRHFSFCFGAGKEELCSPATGSTLPSPSGKEVDERSSSSHGSTSSLQPQRSSGSLSDDDLVGDLPFGSGQVKECLEDGSQPSLQPGAAMKLLEKSSARGCGKIKAFVSATATEAPSEVHGASRKAIGIAATTPDLPAKRWIMYKEKLPVPTYACFVPYVPVGRFDRRAYERVGVCELEEQAVAYSVPLEDRSPAVIAADMETAPRCYYKQACYAAMGKELRRSGMMLDRFRSLQNACQPNIVQALHPTGAGPELAGILLPVPPEARIRTLMGTRGGGLPCKMVIGIALGMFKGVADMHERGFYHLDIQPDNVVVGMQGAFRNCGRLVAVIALGKYGVTVTKGTPAYSAPEVLKNPEEAGPAADMYSAGVTLMTMLTGSDPLVDWSFQRIRLLPKEAAKELHRQFEELPNIGEDLRAVISQCLLVDPAKRPTSRAAIKRLEAADKKKVCKICGQVIYGKSWRPKRPWWDFRRGPRRQPN